MNSPNELAVQLKKELTMARTQAQQATDEATAAREPHSAQRVDRKLVIFADIGMLNYNLIDGYMYMQIGTMCIPIGACVTELCPTTTTHTRAC